MLDLLPSLLVWSSLNYLLVPSLLVWSTWPIAIPTWFVHLLLDLCICSVWNYVTLKYLFLETLLLWVWAWSPPKWTWETLRFISIIPRKLRSMDISIHMSFSYLIHIKCQYLLNTFWIYPILVLSTVFYIFFKKPDTSWIHLRYFLIP